ncbi:glycosyltransferase family 4 protein [candidate division WWE3 bacterium]|nr:glycosyltransferase family 4 protein [candidate division WWE3 bacterium]
MNKKRLRIAQVTNLMESIPPKHKAGLEQMVYYLTEELIKRGHDVTVFGTADSKTSAKLYPLWPTGLSNDPQTAIRSPETFSVWAISEAFRHAEEFDVIHDHTYFIGSHFAKLINTPVVVTMHHPASFEADITNQFGPEYDPYVKIIDSHFADAHAVVVSNFQREMLNKLLGRKSTTIHNGISLAEWENYSTEPGNYFAFLGYLSGNKGAAEAIQAILKTKHKLRLAGPIDIHDHASKEYFKHNIEPYLDGDQIEWVGPLGHSEKQHFLQQAKATLMPIQWDEPFGLVAIESLACGTPVIAWDRAAMPEIIRDGQTGFLVHSIEELAKSLEKADSLSRQQCRQDFEQRFTAEKMALQYEEFYYNLIQ